MHTRRADPLRTRVTMVAVAALLLASPASDASAAVDDRDGVPAHYIVLEIGADDAASAVFYRAVVLAEAPRSASDSRIESLRSRDPLGERFVTLHLEDVTGRIAFQDVVEPSRWIRGEFAGVPGPEGGREIESYRFQQSPAAFAVRIPVVEGARLIVEGEVRKVFDLETLARDADRLPLASVATRIEDAVIRGGAAEPANRVDMLIMGDGYTAAQQANFEAEAASLEASFFNITPYAEYANYVNVTTLFTASNESGADHPPYDAACSGDDPTCCADAGALGDPLAGTYVDTAFGGRYCSFNIHRLAVVDNSTVLAAASAVPDWDNILVVLNDTTYGGSGGSIPVTSIHASAVEIAQHEYGHSFTDLADEYTTPFPGFPSCSDVTAPSCEANVTDETGRDLVKWSPWILPATPIPTPEGNPSYADAVGLFEGARYLASGMYRPRDTGCLMRFLGRPFGEVCAQEYILTLYRGGWGMPSSGIDTIEPGSASPPPGAISGCEALAFSVDLLGPVGGPPLVVAWWVDGASVPEATSNTFAHTPVPGSYPIEVRVDDATPDVHPAMAGGLLRSSRQWTSTCTCAQLALPPAIDSLAVDPDGLSWNAAAEATGYDVIRGDLGTLRTSTGDFSLATEGCLAEDHGQTTLPYSAVPAGGEGIWLLVRGAHCGASGTWDSDMTQVGARDGEIEASGLSCGSAACDDGVREDGEVCDGADFGGESCQTLGFDAGVLGCNPACDTFETSGCHICGNRVCELFGGEDCISCPQDCNGVQGGNPANRYCCGSGAGDNPVGCEDSRCAENGNTCAD